MWFQTRPDRRLLRRSRRVTASPSWRSPSTPVVFATCSRLSARSGCATVTNRPAPLLAEYLDFHARNSLEEYVTLAQRAKDEGLPGQDRPRGRLLRRPDGRRSPLLAQYPFDVLIGSVHWLGTWQFDDYDVADARARVDRARRRPVLGRLRARDRRTLRRPTPSTCSRTPISLRWRATSRPTPATTGTLWPSRPRSPTLDGVLVGRLEEARR